MVWGNSQFVFFISYCSKNKFSCSPKNLEFWLFARKYFIIEFIIVYSEKGKQRRNKKIQLVIINEHRGIPRESQSQYSVQFPLDFNRDYPSQTKVHMVRTGMTINKHMKYYKIINCSTLSFGARNLARWLIKTAWVGQPFAVTQIVRTQAHHSCCVRAHWYQQITLCNLILAYLVLFCLQFVFFL